MGLVLSQERLLIDLQTVSLMRTLRGGAGWDPGRQPSAEGDGAGTLNLAFPASRTAGNTFLLFISYPVCGILLQQSGQRQIPNVFMSLCLHPAGGRIT